MATRVASLYADVNANVGGFMSGMTAVKGTLASTASGLQNLSMVAVGVGAALVGVGVAISEAWELGSLGAQILQTEDSFNSMATSLGQGPGLLGELQAATRGTVSEFDLMNSTNKLLMGTTGELGKKLADAAPQLAAIAQAAHDLNPEMGTTAEMYDRLSRGVKKAEPELLDEVGILMNLTQVYRDYANAHGITVTAMDKTMKTEAMLNAVLQQGNTLIQQAANVNTGYTTSIDQMNASIADAKNEMAERFAPAVITVANAVTTSMKSIKYSADDVESAMRNAAASALYSSSSYDEYIKAVQNTAGSMGYIADDVNRLIRSNVVLSQGNYDLARSFGEVNNFTGELSGGLSRLDTVASQFGVGFSKAIGDASKGTSTFQSSVSMIGETVISTEQIMQTWADRTAQGTEYTYASAEAIDYANERIQGMTEYYAQLEAAEQQRIMTAGLMAGIQGTLGDATTSYSATLAQLTTQETEISTAIAEATLRYGENSTQVQELNQALLENQAAQDASLASIQQVTAEMIYQQAAAGLDTQAALDLARSMGVLSEADYVVSTSIQSLRENFDLNHDSMISASEGAADYASQVNAITKAAQSLQAKNLPVTFENMTAELQQMAQTEASAEIQDVGAAASEAAPGMEDVASASSDAAGAMGDTASSAADTSSALADIGSAAGKAASGISSAGSAARTATGPLNTAAAAADRVADALGSIPGRTNISVSVSGVDSAIAELQRLASAVNNVPTSLTIQANVISTTSYTSTEGPQGSQGGAPYKIVPPMTITENYYVYNPLAATILAQNKRLETQRRLEAVMNG